MVLAKKDIKNEFLFCCTIELLPWMIHSHFNNSRVEHLHKRAL